MDAFDSQRQPADDAVHAGSGCQTLSCLVGCRQQCVQTADTFSIDSFHCRRRVAGWWRTSAGQNALTAEWQTLNCSSVRPLVVKTARADELQRVNCERESEALRC